MNVTSGDFIKHKDMMDVAIKVHSVTDLPDRIQVEGYWFNLGFQKSWPIKPIGDRLEIFKKELYAWRVCKNQAPRCLRYEKWAQV